MIVATVTDVGASAVTLERLKGNDIDLDFGGGPETLTFSGGQLAPERLELPL